MFDVKDSDFFDIEDDAFDTIVEDDISFTGKKPPVPQAKSAQRSPIFGWIIFAMKSVTARGV